MVVEYNPFDFSIKENESRIDLFRPFRCELKTIIDTEKEINHDTGDNSRCNCVWAR